MGLMLLFIVGCLICYDCCCLFRCGLIAFDFVFLFVVHLLFIMIWVTLLGCIILLWIIVTFLYFSVWFLVYY